MAKNVRKNKNGLIMAGRGSRSYLTDQRLRGRGSTKWGVRVLGAEGPVSLTVGQCPSHSSPPLETATRGRPCRARLSLDRLPGRHCGRLDEGRVGQR